MYIRSLARASRVLIAAALLLVLAVPAAPGASAQDSDPRLFAQTNFRIDNDAFWDFFQHRGSVRTFGYPVSHQFRLDGFIAIAMAAYSQQNDKKNGTFAHPLSSKTPM